MNLDLVRWTSTKATSSLQRDLQLVPVLNLRKWNVSGWQLLWRNNVNVLQKSGRNRFPIPFERPEFPTLGNVNSFRKKLFPAGIKTVVVSTGHVHIGHIAVLIGYGFQLNLGPGKSAAAASRPNGFVRSKPVCGYLFVGDKNCRRDILTTRSRLARTLISYRVQRTRSHC